MGYTDAQSLSFNKNHAFRMGDFAGGLAILFCGSREPVPRDDRNGDSSDGPGPRDDRNGDSKRWAQPK